MANRRQINPNEKDWDSHQYASEWTSKPDIQQDTAILGRLLKLDEGPQGAKIA
jgi:hypothetical protein